MAEVDVRRDPTDQVCESEEREVEMEDLPLLTAAGPG
jgi:hypothetical protein